MEPEKIALGEGLELHYYPRFLDDYESLFREAEKLRPAVGRRQNGAWQSVSLPVGRLMSSSTNCEVTVSDVVSMIVIVPPHESRTTVSTSGRPGCHMEASERRSRSRSM